MPSGGGDHRLRGRGEMGPVKGVRPARIGLPVAYALSAVLLALVVALCSATVARAEETTRTFNPTEGEQRYLQNRRRRIQRRR